jgi:hypothetical protein
MHRATLAVILIAGLTVPVSAAAQPSPRQRASGFSHAHSRRASSSIRRDPISLALTLAERYWGATPCGGRVAVAADMALPGDLDPSTDAWVTFQSSLGANNLAAPPTTYTACTIALAHWQWPTTPSIRGDWGMFCLTIVHEVGHLLGHVHSLVPGSVMAPVFTDESDVPPICRRVESMN